MSRRRQIYEGKAKILYEGPEPGTLIQYFKDDATAFNAVAENFLAKCLGGRAEPIGQAMKASTAQVPHGAEYSPGLTEALGTR